MDFQSAPKTPHSLSVEKLLQHYQTNLEKGLRDEQVLSRFKRFGRNTLPDPDHRSPLHIFLLQFKSTIFLILFIAAFISYLNKHYLDVYIILGILIANAIVGFIQEFQAERSIEALKHLVVPKVTVVRNNKEIVVSSHELVPGDLILLKEGDHIPADARIVECHSLQCNESSITGESLPVNKDNNVLDEKTPMAERLNMLWMGSAIVSGKCRAIVTDIGKQTALGSIAVSLRDIKDKDDHFKVKTNELGKQMAAVAVLTVFLVFIVGFFIRKFSLDEILMFSIASLVSAIPESLPIILTLVLAMSAKRMVNRNALVRRLSATETLAVIDTIITDKTGTLTENKMAVSSIALPYQPLIQVKYQNDKALIDQAGTTPTEKHFPLQKALDIVGSCHSVSRIFDSDGTEVFSGDPTEVALVRLADSSAKSTSYYQQSIHQIDDMPFNQHNRWRATLVEYQESKDRQIFVVGSPETVLAQTTQVLLPDHQTHTMQHDYYQTIQNQIEELSQKGMRVLALTFKNTQNITKVENEQISELIFVGLVGLIDPPRSESKEAIATAHTAGIRVVMATGDHPLTAGAIGKQLGLIADNNPDCIMTEAEFSQLSDKEVVERLEKVRIFARMTPAAKLRLATIYQDNGHVIAMTGDGVNDAPALKQADIGISMGKNGTDVAREASDIVLADDNFASIIAAIEEGRTQFRNVRRTSFFYVTNNLAETLSMVIFLIIGLPIPLLPKQILWLNLVAAGVTDFALATERSHDDVLTSKPKSKNEPILNKYLIPYLIISVVVIMMLSVIFFLSYLPQGVEKARTIVFIILSLSQIYNVFNMRSLKRSVFEMGIFSSRNINIAVVVSFTLMLSALYVPGMKTVFDFAHVSLLDLLICMAAPSSIFGFSEIYKKHLIKIDA